MMWSSIIGIFLMCCSTANTKSSRSLPDQCKTCTAITDEFKVGLDKTARSNFGGGNTRWEEKLGKFATSETRLVEITDEFLCKKGSKEAIQECNHVFEESEEMIEEYWFNVFSKEGKYDLHRYLCMGRLKVCCPENSFGKDCNPCPGDKDKPCFGRGKCDGEGTRGGTGLCLCEAGYSGDLCDTCSARYYLAEKTDSTVLCKACDATCESTCKDGGPSGCDSCRQGYVMQEQLGCQDVDECKNETFPCNTNEYCVNTVGNYSCFACSRGCDSCTAAGQDHCTSCIDGYFLNETTCQDVDECLEQTSHCSGENEHCANEEGGYDCVCDKGYERVAPRHEGGVCLVTPSPVPVEAPDLDEAFDEEYSEKHKEL